MVHERLTALDKYLFDTFGFVVIRNVLTPDEVKSVLKGVTNNQSGRLDCGTSLAWGHEDGGDVLRSLLCHRRLAPILDELCGEGHRLDHNPVLFVQKPKAEGFDLHGGAISPSGDFNFSTSYQCRNGQMVCNLINAAVQFSDTETGMGGFVVVPGSHKSNFPYPADRLQEIADTYGFEPTCKAGDVVLFSEAVLHGATTRRSSTDRTVLLLRFAPATCAYGRGYSCGSFDSFFHLLNPAQRAVTAHPYHLALDREVPKVDGAGSVASETTGLVESVCIPKPRPSEKKLFDGVVFGNSYY